MTAAASGARRLRIPSQWKHPRCSAGTSAIVETLWRMPQENNTVAAAAGEQSTAGTSIIQTRVRCPRTAEASTTERWRLT